jgi:arabinogalactan oligomer/maltooligosaccharide transport system permease protein
VVCIFLFPALWLVLGSFSANGNLTGLKGFFPEQYGFKAYMDLFKDTSMYNYPRWFLNTLFIAIFSTVFSTILVTITAYIFSRFKFKSRKNLMKTTLVLGMFPSFMAMIAVFIMMSQFGLVNNRFGLILIYSLTAPLGYLLQKGFFDTISQAIDESAMVDGATRLQIFTRITLPMAKPMLVFTALTSFVWPWNDFILPRMLLINKDLWTVAVGLQSLGEDEFARFAAGSVFVAVPIVLLYFLLVRYMINGLSAGSVKE